MVYTISIFLLKQGFYFLERIYYIIYCGGEILSKKSRLLILFILLIMIMVGCTKEEISNNETLITDNFNNLDSEKLNHYNIEMDLNYDDKVYTGKQTTSYVNNTNESLEELYFHLYPNAFKTVDTAPILFSQGEDSPSSYEGGEIEILKVSYNGEDLDFNIQGEGDTILHIDLKQPLIEDKKADIYLEYKVKLPTTQDRFGYGNKVINGGNWYPVVAVYDEDGWNLDPYYQIGDPFYSDIANYNVRINTDKDVVIASSGNILSEVVERDKKIYEIEGKLIRDFAWSASKDFKIAEKKLDNTNIKLYYLDKDKSMIEESLEIGEKSIRTFSKLFGQYPYGVYSIVMTEFPSGMEYPGVVFISDELFKEPLIDMLEQVIVHETAHQWWYGLVGNDQIKEAWLDESLATYSEVLYNVEVYNKEKGEVYYTENIEIGYELAESYLTEDDVVNKPLDKFVGWDDYGPLVYSKGGVFVHKIREEYGYDTLIKILNQYFKEYKFKVATTEDFIRICEEITQDDLSDLVDEWLY